MMAPTDNPNMPVMCYGYNHCPYMNNGGLGPAPQPIPPPIFTPGGQVPWFPPPFPPNMAYPRRPPCFIRPFMPPRHFGFIPYEGVPYPVPPPEFEPQQSTVVVELEDDIPVPELPSRPLDLTVAAVNFSACEYRFSGTGDVRPFISAILSFKNAAEISDESALRSFPLLLTDTAAIWWRSNETTVSDWNSAIQLLRDNYKPCPQPCRVYKQLLSLNHRDESTARFVQRVKCTLAQLPAHTLTEETKLDLVYALLNRRIKEKVNRNDIESFAELLAFARQVEEDLNAEDFIVTPNSTAPNTPRRQPVIEVTSNTSPLFLHSSSEIRCNSCDSCKLFGHLFKGMCKKMHKKQDQVANTSNMQQRKVICIRCKSSKIMRLRCQNCSLMPFEPEKRALITVNIYGTDFDIVLNTGQKYCIATNSLVRYFAANQHNFIYDELEICYGKDILQQIFCIANVEVWVGGVAIMTTFVQVPHARENALGMDFVRNAGLLLDFRDAGFWAIRDIAELNPVLYERFPGEEDQMSGDRF